MFPPVFLLNYDARLPWQVAPLIWLAGVALLGSTRLTHRLYPRFGRGYYIFSALARPLGIILIGWGWLEVLAPRPLHFLWSEWTLRAVGALVSVTLLGALALRKFFIPLMAIGAFILLVVLGTFIFQSFQLIWIPFFAGAFCYSLWSIYKLGIRPSLLYSRYDDPLINSGPYTLVRHPQLLAAIIMAFSGSLYFSPDRFMYNHAFAFFNAFAFSLALWTIILVEEKDLREKFGPSYLEYMAKTPRLFPAISNSLALQATALLVPTVTASFGIILFLMQGDIYGQLLEMKKSWLSLIVSDHYRLAHSEAKTNLGIFWTLQHSYFEEHGRYSDSLGGFSWDKEDPRQVQRFYDYCIGTTFFSEADHPHYSREDLAEMKIYAEKLCARCSGATEKGFTILAIGNMDRDPLLDVWSLNDYMALKNLVNDYADHELMTIPAEDVDCR